MRTAICIASGPSLTQKDVDYCRGKGKVYAVNDVYRLAPWADRFYACDYEWWKTHIGEVIDLEGEKWTVNRSAAREYGLEQIDGAIDAVWSNDPRYIATGGNSGFQALNLAVLQGAERVILLGYDMQMGASGRRHFFGDHPGKLNRSPNYNLWVKHFSNAAPKISVEVINRSPRTALHCFSRKTLQEAL